MRNRLLKMIEKIIADIENRRLGAYLVLTVLVLFLTILPLSLPAITLGRTENVLDCQYRIHKHSEDCYREIQDEDGQVQKILVCGYADYVVHLHDENCYDENGQLVCRLPEIPGHDHDETCYSEETILTCGMEEGDDHQHSESCYETVRTLICQQDELHIHDKDCYDKDGNLVCGKLQLEEHQHGEACFVEREVEDAEASTESNGENAQLAGSDDSSSNQKDNSDKSTSEKDTFEKSASEEELSAEKVSSDETVYYESSTDHVKVYVSADKSAFPEGTTMAVRDIDDQDIIDAVAEAIGGEAGQIQAVDISFRDAEGKEIEPAVSIRVMLSSDIIAQAEAPQVVHVDDQGKAEIVELADPADPLTQADSVVFEADSFSAYAIVEGPGAVPIGWHKVSSIDELIEKGSEGLYIGHPNGFYFTSDITNISASRTGITKTKPTSAYPATQAVKYYFENVSGTEKQFKVYCQDGDEIKYITQAGNSLNLTTESNNVQAFTIDVFPNSTDTFRALGNGGYYWNMQGGDGGASFAAYNNATDTNARLQFWYYDDVLSDPFELDGKSYGLMNWAGGAAGKAMMASEGQNHNLEAKSLTVMSTTNNSSQLFAPNDSEISMWTFHWIAEDRYYLTAVVNGSSRYLKIDANGLSFVDNEDDASQIQVVPGTGIHAGEICLKEADGGTSLTFSGTVEGGFSVGGTVGSEWLYLVELSELTNEYFMPYSARKVSVSDPDVTNGSRIIVYTRSWNDEKKKYEFYAISSDGKLVPVYESGDSIEWVGGQLNNLLWNFVEYYWEGTTDPNFYYELYNQYSEKYVAPQVTDGQILSDDTIGINLNGRRDGQYYSTILAWDEDNYSYVGYKVENGQIISCPKSEAMDFYFAVMQEPNVDDELTTVKTVDHTQYGITMKIVNFGGTLSTHDGGSQSTEQQYLVIGDGTYIQNSPVSGLLSTHLGDDNYPVAVKTNKSLGNLFAGAQEVNHLFIDSTYSSSGYYEFDSTQNFATLDTATGEFKVYKELGTMDGSNKNTLKHGQFMPYNDLEAGLFASVNGKNLYDAEARLLADSDPRKYEQMYLVKNPDYYYGVELEASFTQTPDGLDAWGHDIIYEFTGDDDFWLYVDGELVIDLGGIHGAMPGSVNFRTGEVCVNGTWTTLKDLFYNNFKSRYMEEHPDENESAAEAAAENYVGGIFVQKFDSEGSPIFDSHHHEVYTFKDDTTHTMNIFYMERGAGAANLHMRFNLAAVKKGSVQLHKELSGVDDSESVLAEFPYQIWYKKIDENGDELAEEYLLTNALPDSTDQKDNYVFYKDTVNPVKYAEEITIDGVTYQHVFFLKPDETADISFPPDMSSYRIVECGVNTDVYSGVTVDGETVNEITQTGYAANRKDYGISYDTTDKRPKVNYNNAVKQEALRTLIIQKKLYREDGTTEITASENDTEFTFRLYLASEFDELDVANMYTYHVKDPDGNYCSWDAAHKEFVKIGEGINDYSSLSDTQKAAASFTTSIYGSIGKIRADYTVEIRNVLAGTKYRLEERSWEIPDGYSFQKYDGYDNQNATVEVSDSGVNGVQGTVVANMDAPVVVCNLKGWGLRINKIWTDADYMQNRDPTYFAVFRKNTGDTLDLVENTVQKLDYNANPQTLYWYFDHLPIVNTAINDYVIREVKLSGSNLNVDSSGVVTGWTTIEPVNNDTRIQITGQQKGETQPSPFDYNVTYVEGKTSSDSNVRVDTATNDRPGILLKKEDMSGNSLTGAVFTLKDDDGNLIGTFTSDKDGIITVAYLRDNVDYTLTETKTPQGYSGLNNDVMIRKNGSTVTVTGIDSAYYGYGENEAKYLKTIIFKNRPNAFQVIKKDSDSGTAMQGVHFALHKQKTVNGVTNFDISPESGFEDLVTDQNGLVPGLDNTLPAGIYELREKSTLEGYHLLPSYIYFTVNETGVITLGDHPDGVALSEAVEEGSGAISYILTITNSRSKKVSFMKVDIGDTSQPLEGAVFDLYQDENGNPADTPMYESLTSDSNGILTYIPDNPRDSVTVFELPIGTYYLVETQAPEGYNIKEEQVIITVSGNSDSGNVPFDTGTTLQGVTYEENSSLSESGYGKSYDANTRVYTLKISNNSGYELPSTGGRGTRLFYLLGGLLIAFALLLSANKMMSIRLFFRTKKD
ncbi:MAG: LPXTG cell wall anchor domain-containing protein [Eubacterium sp.]|nr:LPXTG cell wall anchor domain-containing protein [Eubacterium sp.]